MKVYVKQLDREVELTNDHLLALVEVAKVLYGRPVTDTIPTPEEALIDGRCSCVRCKAQGRLWSPPWTSQEGTRYAGYWYTCLCNGRGYWMPVDVDAIPGEAVVLLDSSTPHIAQTTEYVDYDVPQPLPDHDMSRTYLANIEAEAAAAAAKVRVSAEVQRITQQIARIERDRAERETRHAAEAATLVKLDIDLREMRAELEALRGAA